MLEVLISMRIAWILMRLADSISYLQAKTEGISVPGRCRRDCILFRLAHRTIRLPALWPRKSSLAWPNTDESLFAECAPLDAMVVF